MPIVTDPSLLNETTSPATNYDFSDTIPTETGIEGFTYTLYWNERVMLDWEDYAANPVNDLANYSNIGNFDGKALRVNVSMDGGFSSGDVACLADIQLYVQNEDGAVCLQWVSSGLIRTHRLTPTQWHDWSTLDVGTDGQVTDPPLLDSLPAFVDGS